MTTYGYCRISRKQQSIERQIRNIKNAYPEAIIIQEVFTRTSLNRKEWVKLFNKVIKGDIIVFDSVSRLSGNAEEGFQAYQELYKRGVELVFLKERHIDTETYKKALESNIELTGTSVDFILEGVNRYMMELAKEQIKIAFDQSEKEVLDLRLRTKEGIETARLNGKQIGQQQGKKLITKKSIQMKEKIVKMAKDFEGNMTDKEVIEILKLSRNSYYKYKRELLAEE